MEFKNYESFLNEGYTDLLRVARSHPYSRDTETGAYPTSKKVPHEFFQELGVKLKDARDYVLVLEIQFDTNKLFLQGHHHNDGENYDGVFSYDIKSLSNDFQKWLIDSIVKDIERIRMRKISTKYGL